MKLWRDTCSSCGEPLEKHEIVYVIDDDVVHMRCFEDYAVKTLSPLVEEVE